MHTPRLFYGVVFYAGDEVFHQDVSSGDVPILNADISYSAASDIASNSTFYANLPPDPTTRRAAMARPDADLWVKAEYKECDTMFNDKKCLQTVFRKDIPDEAVIMPMKWVYKIKKNPDGSIERYKARLVAKGFRQIPDVHFDAAKTFAPSASTTSFRLLIIYKVMLRLYLFAMDVKSAFLNSVPKYDNYIILPDGLMFNSSAFALMLKNIYGTRDAARGWYDDQHTFLTNTFPSLIRSKVDPCLYFLFSPTLIVLIVLTVDDYAVATSSVKWYTEFIKIYAATYACTDLGKLTLYNGISVDQLTSSSVFLCQTREVTELLRTCNMADCNPARTPMEVHFNSPPRTADYVLPNGILPIEFASLIGSLLWIARMTRPDILFAVIFLSSYMKTHTEAHVTAAKRVLRYLQGTIHFGLLYDSANNTFTEANTFHIRTLSDADWGGLSNSSIDFWCSDVFIWLLLFVYMPPARHSRTIDY